MRRRDLLLASGAAAALAGCRRAPSGSRPRVLIARARDYDQSLHEVVRRIVAELKVEVCGRRVVLKPNLVEYESGASINTHPLVVGAALEAFRSLGAAEVRIAEGPGHRRITLDLAEAAGYFEVIPRFEEIFTDLNLDELIPALLSRPRSRLKQLHLPRTVLQADLLVSLAKMKTHHWAGATLGMKNLFGVVPGGVYGWPKNLLHWAGIHESIADLHALFPRQFVLVDGVVGMEGNGPIQGRAKAAGVLVAGSDPVAVDATCCRVMGIDPGKVGYLKMAESAGQTQEGNVEQIGEPVRAVATRFELLKELAALQL
jgi:uncharacterized protein (DUF362 family)